MPKTRPPYPEEYRQRIVELHAAGRSIESLAREFEPSATTISNWIRQAKLDAGERDDGLTTDERDELRRLRRENRRLRMEREILEKAAAWFAREGGSIPKRDSHS
jgi:transposase